MGCEMRIRIVILEARRADRIHGPYRLRLQGDRRFFRFLRDRTNNILKIEVHDVDVAGGEEIVDGGFRDIVVEIGGLVAAHLIRLEF